MSPTNLQFDALDMIILKEFGPQIMHYFVTLIIDHPVATQLLHFTASCSKRLLSTD